MALVMSNQSTRDDNCIILVTKLSNTFVFLSQSSALNAPLIRPWQNTVFYLLLLYEKDKYWSNWNNII